jgi:hypothetical protein
MPDVIPPDPLPADTSVGGILLVLTCVLTLFSLITTVLRIWARWARCALGWVGSLASFNGSPTPVNNDRMTTLSPSPVYSQ